MSSTVVKYINDVWKSRNLDHDLDTELDFSESKINLNHALDFDPFLVDLVNHDTLEIIMEVSQ